MTVTRETLRRMLEEFGGLPMTDEELDRVLPHIQNYVNQAATMKQLDLAQVWSGRLLRADEGRGPS
jgi:hypothetical protein